MAKIFIAYKRADVDKAQLIRRRLEELAIEVFIDFKIGSGEDYLTAINSRLDEADAVLVLWSEHSVRRSKDQARNFVMAEAEYAYNNGRLVAAALNKEVLRQLPVPFNTLHAPDLSEWFANDQSWRDEQWQSVLRSLGDRLGRPLVGLAEVLAQGSADTKRAFLRKFPDDPLSAAFADELEALERTNFDTRLADAQARMERDRREAEKTLKTFKEQFEESLPALRKGGDFRAPDPLSVLGADSAALRDRIELLETSAADERLRAAAAELHVGELNSEAVKLREDVERLEQSSVFLRNELTDRDRTVEAMSASLTAADNQRGPGRHVLSIMLVIVGLALGAVAHRLATSPGPDSAQAGPQVNVAELAQREQQIRDESGRIEREGRTLSAGRDELQAARTRLSTEQQSLNNARTELQASLTKLRTDQQALDTQRKQIESDRAKMTADREELVRREASIAKSEAQSREAQRGSASAAQCDALTAYQFDLDRPKENGYFDDHSKIDVEQAGPVCTRALAEARTGDTRRRLILQLGRIDAANSYRQAMQVGDHQRAREFIDAAVRRWNEAASMGSGQAFNVLGYYEQGGLNLEGTPRGPFRPKTPDNAKALDNYVRAAQLGNPLGLTNAGLGLVGVDQTVGVVRNERLGLSYLEQARKYDLAGAYYGIGRVKMSGLPGIGLAADEQDGLRNLALACEKGHRQAREFFRQNPQIRRSADCPVF